MTATPLRGGSCNRTESTAAPSPLRYSPGSNTGCDGCAARLAEIELQQGPRRRTGSEHTNPSAQGSMHERDSSKVSSLPEYQRASLPDSFHSPGPCKPYPHGGALAMGSGWQVDGEEICSPASYEAVSILWYVGGGRGTCAPGMCGGGRTGATERGVLAGRRDVTSPRPPGTNNGSGHSCGADMRRGSGGCTTHR